MRAAAARGFTLIEVLVALVIVATGMAALMGALSSSASTVAYLRDKTFAEWVALNQIANFRLQLSPGQIPVAAKTNGDVDYAGRSWHWQQEIVATQLQGMMRVDVKVRPKDVKAGDDQGWYVSVSGLTDDAMAAPGSAIMVDWEGASLNGGAPGLNTGTQLGNGASTNGNGTTGLGGTGTNTGLGSPPTTTPNKNPITNPPTDPNTNPGSNP